MIYVGGGDCEPCVAWKKRYKAGWVASPEFARVTWIEIEAPRLSEVYQERYWPGDLGPVLGQLPRKSGTPRFLIVKDGKVVSNEFGGSPLKSRTRGRTMAERRSKNSYMRSPRNVTMQPMGMPLRILKLAIGCKVTLRKARMYEFLDRLINIALPRVRDFRGLNPKSFDGRGNYSLGIKEHIVFPEIDYDKTSEVWGMDITVCTTARSDDEARAMLTAFNFPFRQ